MNNDEKIMELKSQIKEKKANLKKLKRFIPLTNCSLDIDGTRYNLQVLNEEQLISLLVRLNSYRMSAEDLNMLQEYQISGFKVEDWITDIKLKIEIIAQRKEENKLQELESKLHTLLSNDKKVELEIDSIIESLK